MADRIDNKTTEATSKEVSRRSFIKEVISSGVAVSSANYLFRASTLLQGQPLSAGLSERLITLNVNGQPRRVDVMKQETLAWTLRYKLGLTGTKLGCDRAECGSCTVLIDDVPLYSCSVLTHTVRGRKVLTVEGLASADGTLHPVQQGIIDEQGETQVGGHELAGRHLSGGWQVAPVLAARSVHCTISVSEVVCVAAPEVAFTFRV